MFTNQFTSISAEKTFPKTIVFTSIGILIIVCITIPIFINRYLKYKSKKEEEIMIHKDQQYQMKQRINVSGSDNSGKKCSDYLKDSKEQTLY